MTIRIKDIAVQLDEAARNAQATSQISQTQPISLEDAYTIQYQSIHQRLKRGEHLTGYKLGFTSKAKMEQMGVHDIIWGRLTNSMQRENNGSLNLDQFIHPRVEPEIAFLIAKDIGQSINLKDVPHFIDGVAGALEIIDSRYENFKFSLEDVIADNCSSSAYVIGEWHPPATNIQELNIQLQINKEVVQTGTSTAILGNPLLSLVEIAKMMERYGFVIPAGSVVLAGAATSAVYLKAGDQIEGQFESLGMVKLNVLEKR